MCDTQLPPGRLNSSMTLCDFVNNSFLSYNDSALQDFPLNDNGTFTDLSSLRMVNMTQLISYALLFPLAAVGNLMVFLALFRNRHRKSRVNLMLLHLSVADMIVTFVFLPTEITWNVNIEWVFGNLACKFYKYISAFGFYISSMVLVCVSLDRYFAVLHPLKVNDAQRRGKIMLFFAWLISAVISLPQGIIFSVQTHPMDQNFHQCVTFGFLNNNEEMIYTIFVISFLYFIPLTIIIFAYTKIIIEITKKSRENKDQTPLSGSHQRPLRLRRSNATTIEKARTRTLSMTFIIVMAFVWCWTPYSICTLWNYIDQDSFRKLNRHLQDIFLIIAVSNSVVNPFIYGRYSLNRQKRSYCSKAGSGLMKLCKCLFPFTRNASCRKNKFSSATGPTKSNLTLYTPSTRAALYRVNRASPKEIQEDQSAINSKRNHSSLLRCEPEMISMIPLGGSKKLFRSAAEFSVSEKLIVPSSSSLRNFSETNNGSEASSGYCSTHFHYQSFQDVTLPSPDRLFTVWENHHSC